MNTSLDHLPQAKRDELAHVVQVIRDGFAFATARRTMPRLRNAQLLKIVLYGSYARGDWVDDPVGRYFSDYDLLIVVSDDELTDVSEFWERTEKRLMTELSAGNVLRTPVSPIYHSLGDVNDKLKLGRYFFIDIVRDGIVLFEEPGHPFAQPQPLTAAQALVETREYFDEWFGSVKEFEGTAKYALSQGWLNKAAFDYHQTAERLYHCLFLVRTLYSPRTHNLNKLRAMAEEMEPRLKTVWPRDSKFERRCYELLREAYVKARYSRAYRITEQELAWLGARVQMLASLVEQACGERLSVLREAA